MEWASITEPWFVNANRVNYKTYNTISILQSCGKPFITETKGSNSFGNTTQIWQWCPEPELSADSGEISFVLGATKYSKVKITPGICMPELPWLISKNSFDIAWVLLRDLEVQRKRLPSPRLPTYLGQELLPSRGIGVTGKVTRAKQWGASSQGTGGSAEKPQLLLPLSEKKSTEASYEWT